MKLSEFIKENKNEINSSSFSLEQVVKEHGLGLRDWNKLSDYQRNSFIILCAISTGRKIYYYISKAGPKVHGVYLYINKITYYNAFIFGFDLKKDNYKDEEELRSNIAYIMIMEHTEDIQKQIQTAEQVKKILFPVEK